MKVLVTGANGYLGQGIVKEFLNRKCKVVAASRKMNNVDPKAECVCGDIFDYDDPYEAFGKPDVLVHAAWRNGFVHNDASHLKDLPKHFDFISKMVRSGLKHLVVLGSMHEVGFFEGSIKSDTPCNPQSLYGIAKNSLRQAVELLATKNNVVYQWVRGYYIVGNCEFGSSIFSKIYQAEKRGDELFPFTMGQNQWDFLDYNDFCHQVAAVALQNEYQGTINVCSGHPEKLAERVEKFLKENHFHIKLDYGKFPDRPYDSKAVWADDTIIQDILNKEYTK